MSSYSLDVFLIQTSKYDQLQEIINGGKSFKKAKYLLLILTHLAYTEHTEM